MPANPAEQADQTEQAGQAVAALNNYVEIELTVSWFPTARKVDKGHALEMAAAVSADVKSLSLARKLFDSSEAEVKACNTVRRTLDKLVDHYCIPKIALTKSDVTGRSYEHVRAAGRRLIRRDLLPEFVEMLDKAEAELRTALEALQQALPGILDREATRQGRTFRRADYPEDLRACVAVNYRIASTTVDLSLEQACPELYRRETALLAQERLATVQAWAETFTGQMCEYVNHFAGQLGFRKRVRPDPKGPQARLYSGELIRLLDNFDEPEIPEGQVVAVIQPKDGKEKDRVRVGPMPPEQFAAEFSPYDTSDRRQLRDDAVSKLTEQLDRWFIQADAFGPYKDLIAGQVEKVKEALGKASADLDPKSIAGQLRRNNRAAESIGKAVSELGRTLKENVQTVRTGRRAVALDSLWSPAPEPAEA